MRLFHFSDDPSIEAFEPRPVRIPSPRPPGMEWLNGPLVWAIDDWHQPLYLFPRDCPRILIWPVAETSAQDRASWWGDRSERMVAYIEAQWWERLSGSSLYRYELPHDTFEPLNDAGMHVSRLAVELLAVETVGSLPSRLRALSVAIEIVPSLRPLAVVWKSSMSASGIRLRNVRDWPWT